MKQKVLLVGPLPPRYGGATISFQLFCHFLLANKTDNQTVSILDSNTGDKLSASFVALSKSVDRLVLAARILSQAMSADKIIIFGSQRFITLMGILVISLLRPFGKSVYLRVFGGGYDEYYRDRTRLVRALIKHVLLHAERIVVQTEVVRSRMSDVWGSAVCVVPNCRRSATVGTVAKSGSPERVVFMYSGFVTQLKGSKVLLDAFVDLLQRVQDCGLGIDLRLDLFGEVVRFDSEPLDLKPYTKFPQITVHGFVDNVALQQKYLAADVFVFPSYWPTEGHSGAVVEAMMHGLPIVAADWRAMNELVTSGVNGLLCRPRDQDDLANKLFLIGTDQLLRQTLSRGALRESTKFDANKVLPRLCKEFGLAMA